jgi:hypothetical protein
MSIRPNSHPGGMHSKSSNTGKSSDISDIVKRLKSTSIGQVLQSKARLGINGINRYSAGIDEMRYQQQSAGIKSDINNIEIPNLQKAVTELVSTFNSANPVSFFSKLDTFLKTAEPSTLNVSSPSLKTYYETIAGAGNIPAEIFALSGTTISPTIISNILTPGSSIAFLIPSTYPITIGSSTYQTNTATNRLTIITGGTTVTKSPGQTYQIGGSTVVFLGAASPGFNVNVTESLTYYPVYITNKHVFVITDKTGGKIIVKGGERDYEFIPGLPARTRVLLYKDLISNGTLILGRNYPSLKIRFEKVYPHGPFLTEWETNTINFIAPVPQLLEFVDKLALVDDDIWRPGSACVLRGGKIDYQFDDEKAIQVTIDELIDAGVIDIFNIYNLYISIFLPNLNITYTTNTILIGPLKPKLIYDGDVLRLEDPLRYVGKTCFLRGANFDYTLNPPFSMTITELYTTEQSNGSSVNLIDLSKTFTLHVFVTEGTNFIRSTNDVYIIPERTPILRFDGFVFSMDYPEIFLSSAGECILKGGEQDYIITDGIFDLQDLFANGVIDQTKDYTHSFYISVPPRFGFSDIRANRVQVKKTISTHRLTFDGTTFEADTVFSKTTIYQESIHKESSLFVRPNIRVMTPSNFRWRGNNETYYNSHYEYSTLVTGVANTFLGNWGNGQIHGNNNLILFKKYTVFVGFLGAYGGYGNTSGDLEINPRPLPVLTYAGQIVSFSQPRMFLTATCKLKGGNVNYTFTTGSVSIQHLIEIGFMSNIPGTLENVYLEVSNEHATVRSNSIILSPPV